MKTNSLTDATKVFILVATVIVVCVLCAVSFKMVNQGKSSVNSSNNNFNSMTSQYSEIDLSLYNGSLVAGSEVISRIKNAVSEEEYISIRVVTPSSITDYNYVFDETNITLVPEGEQGQKSVIDVTAKKGENGYINPMAMFMGTTYENSNKNIICIRFEQQP